MRVMKPLPSLTPGSPLILLTKYASRFGSNTTASADLSPLTTAMGAAPVVDWLDLLASDFDLQAATMEQATTRGIARRNKIRLIYSPCWIDCAARQAVRQVVATPIELVLIRVR